MQSRPEHTNDRTGETLVVRLAHGGRERRPVWLVDREWQARREFEPSHRGRQSNPPPEQGEHDRRTCRDHAHRSSRSAGEEQRKRSAQQQSGVNAHPTGEAADELPKRWMPPPIPPLQKKAAEEIEGDVSRRVGEDETCQPCHLACERPSRSGQKPGWKSESQPHGRQHDDRANAAHAEPEAGTTVAGCRLLRLATAYHCRAVHRLGCFLDSAEHAAEDDFVERHDRIPIEKPEQAAGTKAGQHDQSGQGWLRLRVDLLDREIELGLTRQLHFRSEGKRPVAVYAHHPPEVECLAKLHHLRVSPAPTQPRPAHELVHPAAQLPEHITGIPAISSTDPADCCVDTRWIGFDVHHPLVGEEGAPCPGRISGHGARHAPVSFHRVLVDFDFRPVDCRANAQSLVRHQSLGGIVGDDHPVLEPLGQRPGDSVGDWGDEIDPQRTQSRRQHWHRQDDPLAQAELLGHHPHQLPIGEHVGSADLERLASGLGHLEAADEPVQHVGDRHRLAIGGDPFGRHHDREPLDEIAQYFV